MKDTMSAFASRLHHEWLPSFCEAPHRNYSSVGFKTDSIKKLSEFDAHWFMRAVDTGLVVESEGFFVAPRSKAREQIFWEGSKTKTPRSITLWIEPVVTIGALARLNEQFGWPVGSLGAQSIDWAFDLVCYGGDSREERIVCEVKKHRNEIEQLLRFMGFHCAIDSVGMEPEEAKERNAYRKVQGIRRSWPSILWALGPGGNGHVFHVQRDGESQRFHLIPADEGALQYEGT